MNFFETIYRSLLVKCQQYWLNILISILITLATILFNLFIRRFIDKTNSKLKRPLSNNIIRSIKFVVSIAVFITGSLLVLRAFNVSLAPIFTLVSSAVLSLSLALKDLLSNVVKGIQIKLTRPYVVGDVIQSGDARGKVKQITLLNTKLTTQNQGIVSISNKLILEKNLINYSKQQKNITDCSQNLSIPNPNSSTSSNSDPSPKNNSSSQ